MSDVKVRCYILCDKQEMGGWLQELDGRSGCSLGFCSLFLCVFTLVRIVYTFSMLSGTLSLASVRNSKLLSL